MLLKLYLLICEINQVMLISNDLGKESDVVDDFCYKIYNYVFYINILNISILFL